MATYFGFYTSSLARKVSRIDKKLWSIGILLVISITVRLPGIFSRSIWYDEAITLLETTGHAKPVWPHLPEPVAKTQNQLMGTPTLQKIASDLRITDIHPPVYYWLLTGWQRLFGYSLEVARFFSLICSSAAVVVFYLLLHEGKFKWPFLPSLIYSLSSGAVFAGQETRPYALTALFVILAAYFSYRATEEEQNQRIFAFVIVILGGLAFKTHYLALFPIGAILIWYFVIMWQRARMLALFTVFGIISIWLIDFSTFLRQLGSRPHQAVGFPGFVPEIKKLAEATMFIVLKPTNDFISSFATGLFLLLIVSSILYIVTHWSIGNCKFVTLWLMLWLAPVAGIGSLDLVFNKNLLNERYFLLAGPAVAVILTYGVMKSPILKILLLFLIVFQLAVINWGVENSPGWPGSNYRSLAQVIYDNALESDVVVIGAGFGRGHPATVIYELDPELTVIVIDKYSHLEPLLEVLQVYESIWLVPAIDHQTAEVEENVLLSIRRSGTYNHITPYDKRMIHIWR